MKKLFIDLTEEVYEDHKNNKWKDTRNYQPYTWEAAQQQVYKIANKYETEEIIARIFHPSNPEKYPTILKWDKIWEEKWKKTLEREKKNRKDREKVVKDYIAKRWPNGVPKSEKALPLAPIIRRRWHKPRTNIKVKEAFKKRLRVLAAKPIYTEENIKIGEEWLKKQGISLTNKE